MSVRNDGSSTEHLAFVSTPNAADVSLDGDISPAGVQLDPGSTVALGGQGGARVLLHGVHGIDARHNVPFTLGFANVGLVRLQGLPPSR
ncbi:hypothetical protein ABZ078_44005 [Streptomyces sp. NPDC006385]|uniref:hypothetical protein n=1 Tax=Streptomyces sp. NPDC006385 TaxID=3156761 RepID=UPI0033ADB764